MTTPHIHKDIISAYVDGKSIQYRKKGNKEWVDKESFSVSLYFDFEYNEYRIKPESVTIEFTREEFDALYEVMFIRISGTGPGRNITSGMFDKCFIHKNPDSKLNLFTGYLYTKR